jgi:hypothetical protein
MNQTTYAYAQGFATKLAEYNISPAEFIQVAIQTQHPQFMKAAEFLYEGMQMEKQASNTGRMFGDAMTGMLPDGAQTRRLFSQSDAFTPKPMYSALEKLDDPTSFLHTQRAPASFADTGRMSWDDATGMLDTRSVPNSFADTDVLQQAIDPGMFRTGRLQPGMLPASEDFTQNLPSIHGVPQSQGPKRPMGPQRPQEGTPEWVEALSQNSAARQANTAQRNAERGIGSAPPQAAPQAGPSRLRQGLGGAALMGAGGAGLYGMGDADTWQNDAANAANDYLGTDFQTQSRFGRAMDSYR